MALLGEVSGIADNEAPSRRFSMATWIRSAWQSKALRAAIALGFGGLAFACSNLVLARVLPPTEFAQFALLYAIVQVGINIGPFGADVLVTRRLIAPRAQLLRQVFFSASGVACLLTVVSAVLYPLSLGLLATMLVSITAGSLEIAGLSYYRSRNRIGFSLLLSSCANATLLVAALLALGMKVSVAILPAIALSAAFCSTATIAWRGIRSIRRDWTDQATPFPWTVGSAAVSFIGAGIILSSLDRLVIPRFLGMDELATFIVLVTIAGSPFSMLYQAVGYTLVPHLRNAANRRQRRRVLMRESAVIAATCIAAGVVALWVMPLALKWVLNDRYAIGWTLTLAAICIGFLKVIAAIAGAAVNALGAPAHMIRMSWVGWISIGLALGGAAIGTHWGLIGLVYGVGFGWIARAAAIGFIATQCFLSESDHLSDADHAGD